MRDAWRIFFACIAVVHASIVAAEAAGSSPYSSNEWVFLDNGMLRLGVKKSSGACIGYLASSGTNRNLLNQFDHGRLVQQSYYGKKDGTVWGKQPWRWNPVQGGDYKGAPAKVLALNATGTSLYARTQPRHWSGCVDLPEVSMEQWITLTGRVARVHFKMSYSGTNHHSVQAQEIPALFTEPEFDTLVLYDGKQPWAGEATTRSRPGWPNESRQITEHWAAYVDKNDFGVGALVPIAQELTCYRYGSGGSQNGACSYFAPVTRFAITPGFSFEYDLYLTAGSAAEIRETFQKVRSPQ